MKRVLASSLIAVFVSTGVLAQQATDEVGTKVDNITQSAEGALDDAANDTKDAAENLAQEAENLDQKAEVMKEEVAADRPMLRSPGSIEREGYQSVDPVELTADNLTGARVYDANDEDIGEVDELLLNSEGNSIDQVVVDVGGFLGLGEHAVAVTVEELHIMRAEDGSELRVYMDATQEELEAQPEYEG